MAKVDLDLPQPRVPKCVEDAIRQLGHHTRLSNISKPYLDGDSYIVEVDVAVNLPSRARANGVTTDGILGAERLFLNFSVEEKLLAPRLTLRADFPSHFPHINPHLLGERVPPCVFRGDIDELYNQYGLDAIMDQTIRWLDDAASGRLLNLSDGWEPMRRDTVQCTMVYDADQITNLLPKDGSILALPVEYIADTEFLFTELTPIKTSAKKNLFTQRREIRASALTPCVSGQTVALLACAKWKDYGPRVFGEYLPDQVKTLSELYSQAEKLGVSGGALKDALEAYLKQSIASTNTVVWTWQGDFFAIVLLAAHRPISIIGTSERSIEVIPFAVRYRGANGTEMQRCAEVLSVYHTHALTPELLARTSGIRDTDINQRIVLAGCGSIGSKLGVHLGRAGFGLFTFIDNDRFAPHNAARHALITRGTGAPAKSDMMKQAFIGLGHNETQSLVQDACDLISSKDAMKFEDVIPSNTRLFIDASASLRVLAASTISPGLDQHSVRLARALMYGKGQLAVLLLEGEKRNVRVDDLTAQLFEGCRHDESMRNCMTNVEVGQVELLVGENCRSVTTVMSDSTVSRSAALISKQLEFWLIKGFPSEGALCTGRADSYDIGMNWIPESIGATTILDSTGDLGWTVRILAPVKAFIEADAGKWLPLETGGALLGQVLIPTRTIIIGGWVDAPIDSQREKNSFVLGCQGLSTSLAQANNHSLGHLHYVGTWHSHPTGGSHSYIDKNTLSELSGQLRGLPTVSLVWTPQGMICEVMRGQHH